MPLEEDIEIIGLPEEGDFKVVQIIVDGHPVMICGPKHKFHNDLLSNYLKSEDIPFEVIAQRGKRLIALKGERYEIVGMGESAISKRLNLFQLPFGDSYDYKIDASEDFKERLKHQFAGWNF